jgi:hypothetical protein
MSIQKVPVFQLPTLPENIATTPDYGGANTYDIVGNNGYVGYVFSAPETAIIDALFFRIDSAVTSAGQNVVLKAIIGDEPGTSGIPNTSSEAAIAVQAVTARPSTTPVNYEVKFPAPVTLTKGTIYTISITLSSGTVSGAGIRFAEFTDDNQGNQFTYTVDNDTFRNTLAPGFGLGLSGVSALPLPYLWPMNAAPTTHGFRAPDMHGNMISLSGKMRVCGAAIWGDAATNPTAAAAKVNLYNAAGALLTTGSWLYYLPNNTTSGKFNILFPTAVDLNPGTYFLAVSGVTHTLNTVTMYSANFASSFWRQASPMGGTDVMYVSSNTFSSGAPVWTRKEDRQAFISLLIDGVDDGAEGGGGGGSGETSFAYIV